MRVYDGCSTESTPHLQRPEAGARLGYLRKSKEVVWLKKAKRGRATGEMSQKSSQESEDTAEPCQLERTGFSS